MAFMLPIDRDQLLAEREAALRVLPMPLAEFKKFAVHNKITGPELMALKAIERVAWMLGEPEDA